MCCHAVSLSNYISFSSLFPSVLGGHNVLVYGYCYFTFFPDCLFSPQRRQQVVVVGGSGVTWGLPIVRRRGRALKQGRTRWVELPLSLQLMWPSSHRRHHRRLHRRHSRKVNVSFFSLLCSYCTRVDCFLKLSRGKLKKAIFMFTFFGKLMFKKVYVRVP